jgi:pimeloyl-ACP methyl ester carboxylesterase
VAEILPEGKYIPSLGAAFSGGVTMSLHDRKDFELMESACLLAEQSSEPLHLMYGLLHGRDLLRELPRYERRLDYEDYTERPMTDVRAMMDALAIAENIWAREREECRMTCSLARPGVERPSLEIEHDGAALVLHKGSVRSTLSLGSIRVAGFAVSMFTARGVAPSQRAERILEDTRRRALERPDVEPLDRLDLQRRGAYNDKSAVIVFLHGLLSTDVGLFDPLIRVMKANPDFSDCAFVGWPHDTMTSIGANSTILRGLIDQIIGVDGPSVLFVAHSRGGLVARSTAVKLYDKSDGWMQLLRGCVTFGTPHAGCPLAEAPGDLLGKVICIQALRSTGSWLSLADALSYTHQSKDFRGIEDLRPITGGGDFIRDLLDAESRFAPNGMERLLDIAAVGGVTKGSGLPRILANRALGTSHHDLVVESKSSIPPLFLNTYTTDCDHFGYFTKEEMTKAHIDAIVQYCRKQLRLNGTRPASITRQQPMRSPKGWSEAG